MFTPGKWVVSNYRGGSNWIQINQEIDGLPVAYAPGHFLQTNEADARLIAASKDLYQVALDLLPLAENAYGLKAPKVTAIRAIIDQIEGETSHD